MHRTSPITEQHVSASTTMYYRTSRGGFQVHLPSAVARRRSVLFFTSCLHACLYASHRQACFIMNALLGEVILHFRAALHRGVVNAPFLTNDHLTAFEREVPLRHCLLSVQQTFTSLPFFYCQCRPLQPPYAFDLFATAAASLPRAVSLHLPHRLRHLSYCMYHVQLSAKLPVRSATILRGVHFCCSYKSSCMPGSKPLNACTQRGHGKRAQRAPPICRVLPHTGFSAAMLLVTATASNLKRVDHFHCILTYLQQHCSTTVIIL